MPVVVPAPRYIEPNASDVCRNMRCLRSRLGFRKKRGRVEVCVWLQATFASTTSEVACVLR
ncbi:MAG TPA: hypothetical protein DEF51_05050 [Myxococcales bacterium]|nr:hypothetical protein [Myxococcales bacterium]